MTPESEGPNPSGASPRALRAPDPEFPSRLIATVQRALLGKDDAIELAVTALFAGGHLLIEDRPGVGKTLLARSLARALGLEFHRVQCTSDLLPTDLLGGPVYDPATGEVRLRRGPIFTSVLVADELNRTPPRTQSALLECMQEGRVTIERTTHDLPEPFFVIATQNPLQFAGTYPLPESQLDRFLLRIQLGYTHRQHEIDIVAREDGHQTLGDVEAVGSPEDLLAAQRAVRAVRADPAITHYIVDLARSTRQSADLRLGVSTRGAQALHRAARARAYVLGRDYVVPEDVRHLLEPVFGHRLVARGGHEAASAVLNELVAETATPE